MPLTGTKKEKFITLYLLITEGTSCSARDLE